MRAARVDRNHAAIVAALRAAGWLVVSTARMGGGFPDLVVTRRGVTHLVEVKTDTGRLTRDQHSFHAAVAGVGSAVLVMRTVDDALMIR